MHSLQENRLGIFKNSVQAELVAANALTRPLCCLSVLSKRLASALTVTVIEG